MILKKGDHGPSVEQLQVLLKAAGYDPGAIDGDYGARTAAAVLAFQADRPDLEDDGVAGPMTIGALHAATTVDVGKVSQPSSPTPIPCEAQTWAAFQRVIGAIDGQPVRYGPGRGLWHDGAFVVTYGPGKLGATSWPNMLGRPYWSFHCTSFVNFIVSWLLRRNEDYTHAGNIPSLFTLMESGPELHQNPGAGPYRGFGDAVSRITPDGSGAARSGIAEYAKRMNWPIVDARELYARRATLPTFIACGQSTKKSTGWVWWHHVVLFIIDHRDQHRMYRWAADGYKGSKGYSGDAIRLTEITEQNISKLDKAVYRAYGVNTKDGTYGDPSRPIADVRFE